MSRARNFHLPLPEQVYSRLREQATKSGRPATAVAREALEQWLTERERLCVHEEIAAYAREVAGTRDDLDPELEAASLEHLAGKPRGKHGARRR